jgi:hypothetical protein
MLGEAAAGIAALKSAFDLAKGLKDIDDATRRNAIVIDLQEQILAAQQAQGELLERLRGAEAKLALSEQWQHEKQRYELKEIYARNFAYGLKKGDGEPEHFVCATCFPSGKKSILQSHGSFYLLCPSCKTMVQYKQSPQLNRSSKGEAW